MLRTAAATHRHPASAPPARRPMVVSLHRPEAVSGINAWGARMSRLGSPHARWHILVAGEAVSPARAEKVAGGAPSWSVATWRRGASAIEQVRSVRAAIREAGAEVVAPNDVAPGFVAAGLERHRGVRCLAVCHACSGIDEDFYGRVGRLADAWAPVSGRARNRLAPLLARPGGAMPPVVPCGVNVPERVGPPEEGAGPLRLLYAGRLDQHCKRVLDLPRLCAELDGLGIDWTLTVAGDGSARAALAAALAPFGGRVTMLGLTPAAEMPGLYARADCLVLLSAFEGWPVTVIEAMAAGRAAAITTGCGGALDVVRDGNEGVVVATGDMAGLARRLAAAGRGGLAAMGAAAHDSARRHLNLRTQAGVYDRMIKAVLAGRGSDGGPAEIPAQWAAILTGLSAVEAPAPPGEVLGLLLEWLEEIDAPAVAVDLGGGVGELLLSIDPCLLGRVKCVRGVPGGWMGWPASGTDVGPTIVAQAGPSWSALGPLLPLSPPERPNFSSMCFLAAVVRLRAMGTSRLALYGAGRHTRRIAGTLARTPEVVGIVDDRAGAGVPERMWGYPVVRPERFGLLGAQAVIVSSDEHQEAMAARAAAWAGRTPVVRLYSPDGYAA